MYNKLIKIIISLL